MGGLADTIVDPGEAVSDAKPATGLHFFPVTRDALEAALHRAADLLDATVRAGSPCRSNCMRADVSWAEPARDYFGLYSKLLASRK